MIEDRTLLLHYLLADSAGQDRANELRPFVEMRFGVVPSAKGKQYDLTMEPLNDLILKVGQNLPRTDKYLQTLRLWLKKLVRTTTILAGAGTVVSIVVPIALFVVHPNSLGVVDQYPGGRL